MSLLQEALQTLPSFSGMSFKSVIYLLEDEEDHTRVQFGSSGDLKDFCPPRYKELNNYFALTGELKDSQYWQPTYWPFLCKKKGRLSVLSLCDIPFVAVGECCSAFNRALLPGGIGASELKNLVPNVLDSTVQCRKVLTDIRKSGGNASQPILERLKSVERLQEDLIVGQDSLKKLGDKNKELVRNSLITPALNFIADISDSESLAIPFPCETVKQLNEYLTPAVHQVVATKWFDEHFVSETNSVTLAKLTDALLTPDTLKRALWHRSNNDNSLDASARHFVRKCMVAHVPGCKGLDLQDLNRKAYQHFWEFTRKVL